MLDFCKLMSGLACERPVFHGEADFQHALAWRIHAECSDARVRLERPVLLTGPRKRIYVDVYIPNHKVAVELKYVTQKLQFKHECECFDLRFQSAQDTRRYDFLKDVQRLEQLYLSARADIQTGFAILLTNDPQYWNEPPLDYDDANDAEFRIHEGLTKGGCMAWAEKASLGTTKSRRARICLNGSYPLEWRDYAKVGDGDYQQFRYLAIQIGRPSTLDELRKPCSSAIESAASGSGAASD